MVVAACYQGALDCYVPLVDNSSRFSPKPMTYLISTSAKLQKYQLWVQSHRVDLKSIQTVICYYHICVTIESIYRVLESLLLVTGLVAG